MPTLESQVNALGEEKKRQDKSCGYRWVINIKLEILTSISKLKTNCLLAGCGYKLIKRDPQIAFHDVFEEEYGRMACVLGHQSMILSIICRFLIQYTSRHK